MHLVHCPRSIIRSIGRSNRSENERESIHRRLILVRNIATYLIKSKEAFDCLGNIHDNMMTVETYECTVHGVEQHIAHLLERQDRCLTLLCVCNDVYWTHSHHREHEINARILTYICFHRTLRQHLLHDPLFCRRVNLSQALLGNGIDLGTNPIRRRASWLKEKRMTIELGRLFFYSSSIGHAEKDFHSQKSERKINVSLFSSSLSDETDVCPAGVCVFDSFSATLYTSMMMVKMKEGKKRTRLRKLKKDLLFLSHRYSTCARRSRKGETDWQRLKAREEI